MVDNAKLFSFSRFAGMNTVEKDFRLPKVRDSHWNVLTDMLSVENLDIDNSMVLSTRPGSDLKLSGSDIHSLWSDGGTCLYVDNPILYKLNDDYTSTALGTIGTGRVSYAPWNDRIYLTNNSYIGYYTTSLNELTDPDMTYKTPLPAGKFIAYYRARLYVAKGRVLYISDALCDHYDIRTGFRVFENDITMLISVDRGLYIADGNTWFTPGMEPDEFQKVKVLDVDAIPYTAVLINGQYVSDGEQGNYALWTSADGICLGDSSGAVKNLTRHRYIMSDHGIGGAVVRNIDETVHYIATLE